MYDYEVPVFEIKNKLSYYLHKVEEGSTVCITVHNKPKYIITKIEDYEKLAGIQKKEKTPLEIINEIKTKHNINYKDKFDYNAFSESIIEDSATIDHRERQIEYAFTQERDNE